MTKQNIGSKQNMGSKQTADSRQAANTKRNEKRDTKSVILETALGLFASKGYDGVTMREIAAEVGIKAASIYKHFAGKEEIFQSIIDLYQERTAAVFKDATNQQMDYGRISVKQLVQMIQMTFQSFADDSFTARCRRLFLISSQGNPMVAGVYHEGFIEAPIQFNTQIFAGLLTGKQAHRNREDMQRAEGGFDPHVMAYQFYAPILCLLQEYDNGALTMEEAFARIERLTMQFSRVYGLIEDGK